MKIEIILSVIIVIAIGISFAYQHFMSGRQANSQSNSGSNPPTSAPELKPYNNPITLTVLVICNGLIVIGVILAATGSVAGIVVGGIGILAWWAGDTVHKPDPRTAGVLLIWDSYINEKKGGIVVGGRTILANYFPFFLDSTQVDITNVDRDFPMTVISSDDNRLEGLISVTLRPDLGDLIDYIQAGKMERIITQLDDIVYQHAHQVASGIEGLQIVRTPSLISDPLNVNLKHQFQARSFGVEVVKIQARFKVTAKVADAMDEHAAELAQRKGEIAEADTNLAIRKKYEEEIGLSATAAWEEFKTARLIRDGRIARIETDGRVKSIILTDANLNMGGKKPSNNR